MDKQTKLTWLKQQILRNHEKMSVGNLGEKIVESVLPMDWTKYQGRKPNQGDMRIVNQITGELLTLEIKTARHSQKGYSFNLNQDKRGSTKHCDFVILLCVMETLIVPFVIPASFVRHTSSIRFRSFPTEYSGKYSVYRQSLNGLNFEVQVS